ncbi:MAG TPA: glutamate--tRNA ligase [Patescibacteria group bacterium]|nr:glutamate--tRNA ligase [Patescibacteria group bacterium]
MNNKVRTRFAPSPTGYLHVGGIRTALFAWLVARQNDGQFILRIEDTDQARKIEGAESQIIESLQWLGLDIDEGPIRQSDRVEEGIYTKWAQKLIDKGRAYADPYTPDQVQKFREQAQTEKRPFLYRNHRPENTPLWDSKTPLRFKSEPKAYTATDAVMDEISTGPEVVDDFILIKSDGFPTYNFSHIVDDIEMDITHVIRGQEFLASLPNYLNLYEAVDEAPPIFATVPHVLNETGNKKLSKREGALSMLDYRDQGYLPEALMSFIATLGWNDGTTQEVFTKNELIAKFDLKRVQKGGARFDERRLQWVSGKLMRDIPAKELFERIDEKYWPSDIPADLDNDGYKLKVLNLVQERLKHFKELPALSRFFFKEPTIDANLIESHKQLKKYDKKQLRTMLTISKEVLEHLEEFDEAHIQEVLNGILEKTGEKPVVLFSLIRIAITQASASPGLPGTIQVLGKETCIDRITKQIDTLTD